MAPATSIRIHPQKTTPLEQEPDRVPWCPTGRYLAERPIFTLDPHFHSGAYYVQEASSMFLAQLASLFKEQNIKRVLDLCAAPGGKATLLAEMLPQDGFLIANETIRSRVPALCDNMAKWGYAHVMVTNNDAKDFARLPHYFDMVLVDAPCSGEGMFRKDPAAQEQWSPEVVELCAQRQRRIVADVWEALRPGGYLIYSTCTFNRTENENNVAWICAHLEAQKCAIQIDPSWGILEQEGCYRFMPDRLRGEGFFFALLQKKVGADYMSAHSKTKKGTPLVQPYPPSTWIREGYSLFVKNDVIQALPTATAPEMLEQVAHLHGVQGGVTVARKKGNDWAPEPDLALSPIMRADAFPVVAVELSTARRYLAREVFALPDAPMGYVVVQYQGSRLGFAKNLGYRINNLYPSAKRIRMGIT